MDMGIQVRDAELRYLVHEGRLPLASGIVGTVACRVIRPVAVNVHVVISIAALEEDGVGQVAAVDGAVGHGTRQRRGAAAVLQVVTTLVCIA